MSEPAGALARIPGQLDVDEVARARRPRRARTGRGGARGELVAPAEELVDAFVTTLVASPQTQRTYARACRRFVRWLGPLAARRPT